MDMDMNSSYYKYKKYKTKYLILKNAQTGGSNCKEYKFIFKDESYYYLYKYNTTEPKVDYIMVEPKSNIGLNLADRHNAIQIASTYLTRHAKFDFPRTIESVKLINEQDCVYLIVLKGTNVEYLKPHNIPLSKTISEINKSEKLKLYMLNLDTKPVISQYVGDIGSSQFSEPLYYVGIENNVKHNNKTYNISFINAAFQIMRRIPEIGNIKSDNIISDPELRIFAQVCQFMKKGQTYDFFDYTQMSIIQGPISLESYSDRYNVIKIIERITKKIRIANNILSIPADNKLDSDDKKYVIIDISSIQLNIIDSNTKYRLIGYVMKTEHKIENPNDIDKKFTYFTCLSNTYNNKTTWYKIDSLSVEIISDDKKNEHLDKSKIKAIINQPHPCILLYEKITNNTTY